MLPQVLGRLRQFIKRDNEQSTDWQKRASDQYAIWSKRQESLANNIEIDLDWLPSFDLVLIDKNNSASPLQQTYPNYQVSGLNKAKGEFVVFIDSQTKLWPNALTKIAMWLNQFPKTDMLFADTEIKPANSRPIPFFKPNYSIDLLLSVSYFGLPLVVRRSLLKKLNLTHFSNPSFVWDTCLQACEKTRHIGHLATIIATQNYRERLPSSGWPKPSPKQIKSDFATLKRAIKRRGYNARVNPGPFKGSYSITYRPDGKKVTIIISTKDRVDLLKLCVTSIVTNNNYRNWELIVINNNSELEETFAYFRQISLNPKIRVMDYLKPFNIAAIFNFAVKQARGDYICFMGNDTEAISRDWLTRMVGYMQRPEVGAVGAMLLFPDKTIQHCGVILGYGAHPDKSDHVAGHPYSRFPIHPGYFGTIELQRNFSAVTGAVILTRKNLYQKVGGFDAKNLRVQFNDVDFCLKIRRAGYQIVYAPESRLYHRERSSVGNIKMNPDEIKYMRDTWHHWEDNDPFYNPNLTLRKQDYSLRHHDE